MKIKIEETSGGITWSLDDKYIFYSKLDKYHRPRKIYRHKIGSSPTNDQLIFTADFQTASHVLSMPVLENFLSICTPAAVIVKLYSV